MMLYKNRVPETGQVEFFVILVNAFNCRFQLWIADAFTRYTVQTAINFVCGYKLQERNVLTYFRL